MDKNIKTIQYAKEIFNLLKTTAQEYAELTDDLHVIDLCNKSIKMFKWENIPETITKRTIERRLFMRGKLVFFKDDNLGFQIMPFTYSKGLNDEGEYTKLIPLSINGINYGEKTINEDCVVIRDNEFEIPPFIYANYYGKKISELFSIREKNNNWLNLPLLFKSTGDRGKDAKNAFEIKQIMIDGKNEIAFISDAFTQLELHNLKPQYFGAEIEEQIKVMKNNYLEFLGIDHLNFDKKERMITSEVEIKNEENSINISKRLDPRLDACKLIKDIFNIDIKVDYDKQAIGELSTTYNIITSKAGGQYV